jgi:hypothetical protein
MRFALSMVQVMPPTSSTTQSPAIGDVASRYADGRFGPEIAGVFGE